MQMKELINEHRVRGSKCFVEDIQTSYIYDIFNTSGFSEESFDDMLDVKKDFKYSNKDNAYDEAMKSKMIENDVKTLFREYMGDLESRVAQTTGEMTHFMHIQRENVKKIANSRFNQNLKYHNQKFTLDSYITEHYSEFDKTISHFRIFRRNHA